MDYSRDDLLSIDFIKDQFDKISKKDQPKLIDSMLQAAKQEKVPLRLVNGLIKDATVSTPPEIPQGQLTLPDCIQDSAGYIIGERGVMYILKNNVFEVCPYPILLTERYTNIQSGVEAVKLEYLRDGGWRSKIVPRAVIANANRIVTLADDAMGITSENARLVVKYLSDLEAANRDTIPRRLATSRLGWTDYGFVPYVDNIEYVGGGNNAVLFSKFREVGDFEVWRTLSNECCQHTIPKIMVAAAYASILTERYNLNPFCVHLWGETGKGKSVSVMLSASVYGNPDIKDGIVRTGNTTANGIEPVLDFFQNCTAYFDELSTLTPAQIQDLIYRFGQGQGKGRMTRGASAQHTYSWNNVAVFNAEFPIITARSKGGVANRVISLYPEGSIFGRGADLPYIANTLKQNYGFGARRFVEGLKNISNDVLHSMRQHYYDKIINHTEDKQANAMSVLLTAYELARNIVYESDHKLLADEVIPFVQTKRDISQTLRTHEEFIDWVNANYTRFDDSVIYQDKFGNIKDDVINILPTRFNEFCGEYNIDPEQFKRGLDEYGLLVHKDKRLTNVVRLKDKIVRVISIKKDFDNPFLI